jgi:hypothetical protein
VQQGKDPQGNGDFSNVAPTYHHWHFRYNRFLHCLLRHFATFYNQEDCVGASMLQMIKDLTQYVKEKGRGVCGVRI